MFSSDLPDQVQVQVHSDETNPGQSTPVCNTQPEHAYYITTLVMQSGMSDKTHVQNKHTFLMIKG